MGSFYFTLQGMVNIVIVPEKRVVFFASFEISQKRLKLFISIKKKIGRNHGISIYKKALISEHRKSYILRNNNCFFKMSVTRGEPRLELGVS